MGQSRWLLLHEVPNWKGKIVTFTKFDKRFARHSCRGMLAVESNVLMNSERCPTEALSRRHRA
ncbi:MAG: hypothetical protein A4E19_15430 [Nitrospira sp. SG-bin1]|nr:MAG: hypothetical protein A4E19_15430 [Nitrospira sp. SG-bin1]